MVEKTMFKEPFEVYIDIATFGETVLIDGKPVAAIFERASAMNSGFGLTIVNADPLLILVG